MKRPITSKILTLVALLTVTSCDRQSSVQPKDPPTKSPKSAWFQDDTDRRKLSFHHVAGTNWFMADQVGSGIVIQDFDRDGRADLYLVQNGGPNSEARNALYHQQADGTFRDVSKDSGTDIAGHGMGAIAGDMNNDGLADLVVTEYGNVRLFVNTGGMQFRQLTAECGIDNPRWAVPSSFVDFDRDGWLDLVIGNYLDYDPTQVCQDVHGRRDFCSPEGFPATVTRLFRNVTRVAGGAPRFEEVTEQAGLSRVPGVALALVCADFTGDGWPDVFCSDDGRPNRLFVNRQDGTFSEEAAMRGLAFNSMGRTAANMGTAVADFDGDGRTDLFVAHLTDEFHSIYLQDQPGLFRDSIGASGLQTQLWRGTGFGAVAADVDNDGNPDLAVANGLVSRASPGQTPVSPLLKPWWAPYAQRAQIFSNQGNGKFQDVSEFNPSLCGWSMIGRSLAMGDFDQDGGMELVIASIAGPVRILRNQAQPRGHWLQVRLVEPTFGGRDAIGAEVILKTVNRSFLAILQPATSYLSNHEPILHFGLGNLSSYDQILVRWADGTKESFPPGAIDQRITLAHGQGKP